MYSLGVLLSVLFVAASCSTNPLLDDIVFPQKVQDVGTKYRLPKTVKPTEYTIDLDTIMDKNFYFLGTVKIKIEALSATNKLVLNARNITLTTSKDAPCATLTELDKKTNINVIACNFNEELETLQIELEKNLEVKKNYELKLDYRGDLNHDDFHGFYLSTYLDDKSVEKYVATTHFEPASARRAFPCWDEPEYKATFVIIIKHSKEYKAVSNTKGTRKEQGTEAVTTFEKSPKMSTYLVAFVVSQYESKDAVADGVEHKVWVKPHAVEQGKYALDVGQKVLKKLDEFTGIKYKDSLTKMEQIAIQNFSAGAMENWGLVTYKEGSFLYTEGVTDLLTKQGIVTIIAHEFAHQWFGNLVSPTWWKYLWLNEGFATYFQYYIADQLEPKWRLMEYFAVQPLQASAFALDATSSTRPMNEDVDSPRDIRSLFDTIAYQKAGSVIRMMSQILTPKVFQEGLSQYLKDYELKNAESDNLFDSIQKKVTDKNIKLKEIMNEWVNKPGYPVIQVKLNTKGQFEVTQKRFTLPKLAEKDKTRWHIPLTYTTEESLDFQNLTTFALLKPSDMSVTISDLDSKKWIIFNLQQTGYYRVNYDEANWNLLSKYLSNEDYEKIHPINRAQLIDDSINLARAGELSYDIALNILSYLTRETDFIPWTAGFRAISFLDDKLANTKQYETFKLFVRYATKNATEVITFANTKKDDDTMKILRINLLKWACKAESKECVKEVETKFKSWLENSEKNPLDVNLKKNILCAGMKTADEAIWNKMLDKYYKAGEEKAMIQSALGCPDSENILNRYLTLALEKENKFESFADVFKAVLANNPIGVNVSLEMFLQNYDKIKARIGDNSQVESLLSSLGSAIRNEEQYLRFSKFLVKERISSDVATDVLQEAIKNILWSETNSEPLEKWFKDNKSTFTSSATTTLATMLVVVVTLFTQFF